MFGYYFFDNIVQVTPLCDELGANKMWSIFLESQVWKLIELVQNYIFTGHTCNVLSQQIKAFACNLFLQF